MLRVAWMGCGVLMAVMACEAAEDAAKPAEGEPIPVGRLVEEVRANEVRAEKLYAKKELSVVGRVVRVMKNRGEGGAAVKDEEHYVLMLDAMGPPPRLGMRPASGFGDLPPSLPARIRCFFPRGEADELAKLTSRHQVVVRGVCEPVLVPDPRGGGPLPDRMEVVLRNCKVVSFREAPEPEGGR